MDLHEYKKRREILAQQEPQFRRLCHTCRQPEFSCYCAQIQKFNPQIEFVILIHPIEVKRRIATGRMSHLCLENSHLIEGQDYTNNRQVNDLLTDRSRKSMILYPSPLATNLTTLDDQQRGELVGDQKLRLFVIDGTWATARRMVRQSQNLHSLPRICFSPSSPSTFRVRKQPKPGCYSTIEAIHHVIELLGTHCGFNTVDRKHDQLLSVFDHMVELQLKFIAKSTGRYRREVTA